MKNNFHFQRWLLAVVVLVLSANKISYGGNSVPITPINGKVISITVNDNAKNYYQLSKTGSLKFTAVGPAKVEVITRLIIPKHRNGTEKYSIKVVEGKETVKMYSTATEKSDAKLNDPAHLPGKSRKFTLDVPDGTHSYECFLENTEATLAALKISVNSKSKNFRGSSSQLEPLSYDRVVTAYVQEKLLTYFVSSKERHVLLRIVGPTQIEITARLNFDATMKGEQSYALAVYEGDNKVLIKPLSTTKSLGVTYEEWKDVVPGKIDKVFLDVPKGEHKYKFLLQETTAHSVALKFAIPKKDLGNEG